MDICQVDPGVSSIVDVDATITHVQPATQSEPASFMSDIEISNSEREVEIQLEGLMVASLAASPASEDRQLYVHTVFKPDAWEGFPTLNEIPLPSGTKTRISTLERRLTQVVDLISHRHPRLNVLEIELGDVRLSEAVWAGLSASHLSYTFASPGGDQSTTEAAGVPGPHKFQKVQFQSAEDLLGQNFELNHFDLVVLSRLDGPGSSNMKSKASEEIQNDLISSAIHGIMRPGGFLIIARHSITLFGQDQDQSLTSEVSPSLLNACGFEPLLYEYNAPTSSGSLVVTQAMNHTVAILRSPLSDPSATKVSGTVLIVGGKQPLTASISSRLKNTLSACSTCSKVITVPCLEEMGEIGHAALADLRSAVILSDLDEPILDPSTINKSRLENLQQIFDGPNRYVLWLTRGFRDANPYHAASVGLARTIKGETPQLLLQILDLDDEGGEDTPGVVDTEVVDRVVEAYLRLAVAHESEDELTDILWTTESEILLSGGKSLLPRVLPVREANDRTNCTRRVITQQREFNDSVLQLLPKQTDAGLIYGARWELKESSDSHPEGDSTVTVQALYTSVWALDVGGSGSFLHVGVGISAGNEKTVAFLSPTNSSLVTIPRAWTAEIDLAQADGVVVDRRVVAGLLVRSILSQSLVREAESHDGTTMIHEADATFVSILKSTLAASGRNEIEPYFQFSTLNWATATMNSDFKFIHPQSTQRAVQATLSADLTSLVDFSTSHGGESVRSSSSDEISRTRGALTLNNLPGVNLWPLRGHEPLDVSSEALARPHGVVEQRGNQESIISSLMVALERIDASMSSNLASEGSARFVLNAPDVIGHGLQSKLAVVDWSQSTRIEEQVRPLSLRTLLSPEKTYILIGLTGELGESLCRFMVENGARSVVVASR